jgi:hypothetical protein
MTMELKYHIQIKSKKKKTCKNVEPASKNHLDIRKQDKRWGRSEKNNKAKKIVTDAENNQQEEVPNNRQ